MWRRDFLRCGLAGLTLAGLGSVGVSARAGRAAFDRADLIERARRLAEEPYSPRPAISETDLPCENPRAVVLFAHGNAGNLSHRAWLASYLQERLRVSVMMFDYRGYGRSEGTPTAKGILQDGRAASAALAEQAGLKESDLMLMGRSLGGAVVVPLAVETGARGLILQSTFSSMKDVAAFHYPKLSWLVPAEKLNSASLIPQYKGPLLQSHGDADRVVQYESGKKLFEAANEPKQFVTIPGGDHNDAQTEAYYEMLEEFIERLREK